MEAAATGMGLHDHDCVGGSGHQAVAHSEHPSAARRSWRYLREQHTTCGDLRPKPGVSGPEWSVDGGAEHTDDRCGPRRQRASMSSGVDATGKAGDDGYTCISQLLTQCPGHPSPRAARRPGADHRHPGPTGTVGSGDCSNVAGDEEHRRSLRVARQHCRVPGVAEQHHRRFGPGTCLGHPVEHVGARAGTEPTSEVNGMLTGL
jgi:hypothetical protein